MIRMSKKFVDRAKGRLRRYQKILESARARDVNESDTVVIVTDFLTDVLGYAKYEEITTEFAVRCTFCDLAIKRDGQPQYLIEVKSVGTDLRENHLKQAVDYGANQGVEWVLLTNGIEWQAHRVRFEQPISHDLAVSINLLDPEVKSQELLEKLYLISKEATGGGEMDRYWRRKEATNRYVVAQLLLSDPTLAIVRRQLRALFSGLKIGKDELRELVTSEVLKRDVLEGDKATAAAKRLRRSERKQRRAKAAAEEAVETPVHGEQDVSALAPQSVYDRATEPDAPSSV